MTTIGYIRLDVHNKTMAFCAKAQDGESRLTSFVWRPAGFPNLIFV